MIIDVHIHSTPGMGRRFLPLVRQECRRNGVGLCLLSSLGVDSWLRKPSPRDVRAANADARKLSRASGGLVLWYGYINPQLPDWRGEMDLCAREGAIGFKLWITLKDKHGRLDNTERVLDHAGRLNLPVLLHTFDRTDESLPGEITLPEFTGLARRHPRTRMISAHTGVHWPSETGLFKRLPNAWGDISGGYPLAGQLEALVKEMGADRILFGSDLTGRSLASQLAKVVLADISEADKRKILGENAVKVFGLRRPLAATKDGSARLQRLKHSFCGQAERRPPLSNQYPGGRPDLMRIGTVEPQISPSAAVDYMFKRNDRNCPVDAAEDHFCFCGEWPFFESARSTPTMLDKALAGSGIARAYTADLGSIYRQDLAAANREFLEKVRGFKRIKPLAMINPRLPNWRYVLENAVSHGRNQRRLRGASPSLNVSGRARLCRAEMFSVKLSHVLTERSNSGRLGGPFGLAQGGDASPYLSGKIEMPMPKFAGIIISPFLHNWSLMDPSYADIFRWCRKHAIKLWINCRLDDPRFRHASVITREVTTDELLRYGALAYAPETVFQGVFEGAMAAFLKRHKKDRRFRFEISRLTDSTGALRAIMDKSGKQRLVMGSEYPFRDMREVRWTSKRV